MSDTAAERAGGDPLCLFLHSYGVFAGPDAQLTDPNTKAYRRTAEELGYEFVAPALTDLVRQEDKVPLLVIPSLSEQAVRVRRAMGRLSESSADGRPEGTGQPSKPREAAVVLTDSQGLLVAGLAGRAGRREQLIALSPPLFGSMLERVTKPLDTRLARAGQYQAVAEPYGGAYGVTQVRGVVDVDVVVSSDYVDEVAAMEWTTNMRVPEPEPGELWPVATRVGLLLQEYDLNVFAPIVMLPNPDDRLDTDGQLAMLSMLDEAVPNLQARVVNNAGGHRFMNATGRAAVREALASAMANVRGAAPVPAVAVPAASEQ